ncbi:lysosomal acid phosphatase [Biomphalaria pfeifferi]|uniref:acid phosphatase n=1 Tax=Biomphalaria pfeifferi TaxID=112525 RepID=A0AAD8B7K3_BIOPF|nr:lysosomal acid phosphatase [Biomphalaria pfeifferi]
MELSDVKNGVLLILVTVLVHSCIIRGHVEVEENNLVKEISNLAAVKGLSEKETRHSRVLKRSNIEDTITTLVLLQVVFRHGDRSPTHTYPNDPYKDYWPQGLGQLSKVGKIQAHNLGKSLLQNYTKFLGTKYNHSQIFVRSSDYDRTLMTAECVLAGLFPTSKENHDPDKKFFTSLSNQWQPIPVHSVPLKFDILLRPSHSCPFIQHLRTEREANQLLNRTSLFDKQHMLELSQRTGMEMNFTSLFDFVDNIFCLKQHNLPPPVWLSQEMQNRLIKYKLKRELVSPKDAKYLMGTLFTTLLNNMQNKILHTTDPVKINLFSAHESTVRFLKALLGVDNQREVPYIGAVIIELHKFNDAYYVKFVYREDSRNEALLVNGCNNMTLCPFEVFQKAYQDLVFTNDECADICLADVSQHFLIDNLVPILVAVLVLCLALLAFLGYKVYTVKHQLKQTLTQDQYTLLENDLEVSDSEKEFELEEISGFHDKLYDKAGNSLQ